MLAGLIPSLSETPEARIVTVQVSPGAKSTVGSIVNEVRPAPAVAPCEPLESQTIVNQLAAVVTGSLELAVMFAFPVTAAAPFAGVVEVMNGAVSVTTPSHVNAWEALLRGGDDTVVAKSDAFASVSWQPWFFRCWLLLAVGAAVPVPSRNTLVAVPYPTESTIAPAPSRKAKPPPAAAKAPVAPVE